MRLPQAVSGHMQDGAVLHMASAPELDVVADRQAIVQVLSNLIENAVNYGRGPNGVRVDVDTFTSTSRCIDADIPRD